MVKFIFKSIFYKVEYIKDKGVKSGYYLTKRVWVWLLLSPAILVYMMLKQIAVFFGQIWEYNSHWIGSEKKDLDFKQYRQYFEWLSN